MNIVSILLASLISINILKFVFNTSTLLNVILIVAYNFTAINKLFFLKKIKKNNFIILLGVLSLYSISISTLFIDFSTYRLFLFLEFSTVLITGFRTAILDLKTIKKAFNYIVYINTAFSLYLILFNDIIFEYLKSSTVANDLTLSLPLGISCIILFIYILFDGYNQKKYIFFLIVNILASFSFASRGSNLFIIFVFLICVIYYLLKAKKNLRYFLNVVFGTIILGITSYFIFNKVTSNKYLTYEIIRLFTNIENEPRISLYLNYISNLKDFWLTGVGFGNSYILMDMDKTLTAYPHNLFLEIWGEFGIMGFIIFLIINFKLVLNLILYRFWANKYYVISFLCFLYSGFIYSISFSIKGGYLYFIFFGILVTYMDNFKKEDKGTLSKYE